MKMRFFLLLALCFIYTVQAQSFLLPENKSIDFSGFERYGYTFELYIASDSYAEVTISGICDITNNTDSIFSDDVKSTIYGNCVLYWFSNLKDKLFYPKDTTQFQYKICRPMHKTERILDPIIAKAWETKTYDSWDKDSLFDYLKKSDRYYKVDLIFYSAHNDMMTGRAICVIPFKIPVNSIKEIIWIDGREE